MTIGLTSEQLFTELLSSFSKRQTAFDAGAMMADMGLSPTYKTFLDELRKKAPSITVEQFNAFMSVIMAFMDTIVRNNETLAKVIPHVDP